MGIKDTLYPTTVWNGTTPNNVDRSINAAPDANDWNQMLSELIAVQTFALTISGPQAGLLSDGSTPLTANWDVGAFTITGLTFVSDVVTGTAPFTVASTTLVTNLNADTVDGIEGTALVKIDGSTPITGKQEVTALFQQWVDNTDGTTVTFDLDISNQHRVTIEDDRILAVSNPDGAQVFTLRIQQDDPGSRTVTWFATIKWAGGSEPTLTTTADKADTFVFIRTGTDTYDGFIVGQDI